MKTPPLYLLSLLALVAPSSPSFSADGVWDKTKTSGNWSSSSNWIDGQAATGAGASATFNAGTGTTTVNLNANRTIGAVIVNDVTATTNRVILNGTNTLTLSGGVNAPVFNINGNDTAGMDIAAGVILAGSEGFEKSGDGVLTLTGALHTFTGDVILSGGVIRSYEVNALGNRTIRVTGSNTQWRTDKGLHETNVVIGSSGFAISGVGPTEGAGGADSLLTGVMSEENGSQSITYHNSADGANRLKRFIVAGDNSYTGDTTIGRNAASHTVVRATSNNAFGVGSARVIIADFSHDANALELSGGITISDKVLTLAGRGQEQKGALQSLDGDNEWQGGVDLGSRERPTIGVEADSTLTISGAITGEATGAGGFLKEGEGTLILSGANTYSGPTTVVKGKLVIDGEHTGEGDITVSYQATLEGVGHVAGDLYIQGTLAAGNSIGTFSAKSLSLSAASTLAVELGRLGGVAQADRVAVSGPVSLANGTNLALTQADGADALLIGDILWLITTSGTDAVDGVFTQLNGTDTELSEGSQFIWNSQLWSITYQADFTNLLFSGGNDVAIQAIPEPGSIALLGLAAGVLLYRRRKMNR